MRADQVVDPVSRARRMLVQWGRWKRCEGERCYRLGYPSASPIAHAGEGRGGIVIGPAPRDEVAERVDRVVAAMSGELERPRDVVEMIYAGGLTLREVAERMKVSEKTAKGLRAAGEHFIAGCLRAAGSIAA